MQKLEGKTFNVIQDNIDKIKELFPEVLTENKIDIDKLRIALGEHVEKEKERYEFTWNGKTEAIQLAQKQTTGTLLPCKEDSVNWDNTQNLYIEGDNLEVLRILQNSYRNKVKMIYIDPPYNTGKDFVYKDDFHNNVKSYKEKMDENYKSNAETNGRYHTDWLNMIFPRLKVAKNLLKEDGVILIHIDEHEVNNLSTICNEIFGEHNSLGSIIWDKRNPKGDATGVSYQHETILIYAKNKIAFNENQDLKRPKSNAEKILKKASELNSKLGKIDFPDDIKEIITKYKLNKDDFNNMKIKYSLEEINVEFRQWIQAQDDLSGGEAAYQFIDEKGEVFRPVSMAWPNKKKAPEDYFIPLIHPITKKPCPVPNRGWRNPPNTMSKLLNEDKIIFGEDETTIPNRKYLLKEHMFENVPSIIRYGASDDALFNTFNLTFDNPKPYKFVTSLISYFVQSGEYVLDFFSGSATTAHAVMELNVRDQGDRRFIMVQLPEPIDEKSDTYKAGYKNICEIGKERIRLSASKIIDENKNRIDIGKLDLGFKAFKLDDTNLKIWDEESLNIEKSLLDFVEPIKEGRTQEDVVYEILLKYGIDLTVPIEELSISGKTVYSVGMGYLLICLESDLTLNHIEEMAKQQPARIVFYDEGFKDDTVRTNAQQILKRYGVEDIRVI
ncbi:site-specific DNA-methyltransferase [Niallia sp. MER TA 168]|uniref:site-specific DNA-methyltransferase n=1 Tax=Niallia sp. MER TA 168 TaxID=2939568 RepID=UPI00203E6545|nr:site-specific DNA-methyltransferase [Niallia sp. MER TA 168]MCM3364307.1 site-specific DNA-methyltransferase [Niallia sp. MER TA 168]